MSETTQKSEMPKCELADIAAIFAQDPENLKRLGYSQRRLLEEAMFCRTAGMGGHANQCESCRHIEISYNSCRNRHCPKCQSLAKASWLDARKRDLLPVKYCHAVFTLPHELNDLVLYNKKVALSGLFDAAGQTLKTFSENPRQGLAGQLGFTLILHTWDQKMNLHYHLHCLIPAGVYQPNEEEWIDAKYKFLFPVKAMSMVFKGKYVGFLRKAYRKAALGFNGAARPLRNQRAFDRLLSDLMKKEWIVYAKRPFKT